jgi:preprotein translocase subunit SecA
MLQKMVRVLGGDPHKREVDRLSTIVDRINQLETSFEQLSDEALCAKTTEFRQRLSEGETLDDLLPEAFAAVREASKRTIGLRHYDVQMVGGITLHQSKIAEMRTGEGKTLVATLPLYLNAITSRGVHLVTVNDYLARRDARWMAPIYRALGMGVGVLQMASRTENGQYAFIIDPSKESPHEDQHQLHMVLRNEAYKADITYGTNSEFGFDYLRDNLTMRLEDRVQRGHYYAIVDEVDNILIDEARTPLIISGPASEETEQYIRMSQVARQLNPEDYEINEKDRAVSLTEIGEVHVEELLGEPLGDPERPEDITPEQARLIGYLEQALRAQFLFRRNKDYLVQGSKVVIVDEFTGRLMPGRRWSDGLHQAVEAKEGVKVEAENVTYATITLQNYFRMYEKLAGMTGTALTEAEEFAKIYKLEVLPIPMNLEYMAARQNSELMTVDSKDPEGYKHTFYARRADSAKKPIFWKRKDYPDVVFRTEEAKLRAITKEIIYNFILGRPLLVGTTSVEHSERLSDRLSAEPVRRLMQTLLVHQGFLSKNKREQDERAIPELQPLNTPLEELQIGEIRQLTRTLGLELSLNPEDPTNLDQLITVLNLSDEDKPRLIKVLQGGVSHQVLNARKHDEESQIIARAGAFGSVTIATNMAGRGVDIKLGGDLPEEIIADTNRVLARSGVDPYDMTNEERLAALEKVLPEDYGIYEESVNAFKQSMQDMKRVRELGGLHVIGSERHEARRIDNQLRGRAARQGDPGSSRFYLALEDELMRLFGGGQVEGLLKRLNIDESLPIESNMVGRLVEQSQERVEGTNFDIRKHLLEYDDVLNSQRKRIYDQRNRVFTKEDLSEDVLEMLRNEIQNRVPKSFKDEEGPWKLLAFLEEIQPPIDFEDIAYPSYTFRLLIEELRRTIPQGGDPLNGLRTALLGVAERALLSEKEHTLRSLREMLEKSEETLDQQRVERHDSLDTFLEGAGAVEEEGMQPRRPQELLDELSNLVRVPLRLTPELLRQLPQNTPEVAEGLSKQIDDFLLTITVTRVMGALKRRLPDIQEMRPGQIQGATWPELANQFMEMAESTFDQHIDRLIGAGQNIARDLDPILEKLGEAGLEEKNLVQLLQYMSRGTRMVFDRKTHRQTWQVTNRLSYVYLAARLLEAGNPQTTTNQVLDHLEDAQLFLMRALGRMEWGRLVTTEASLGQLDRRMQEKLKEALSSERFEALAALSLTDFNASDRDIACDVFGARVQTEIYRHILLTVISDLWVDYLTKVEALRVSIGLEAYAQRDPLVQYKSQATVMFQNLLSEIRLGVISRMFNYQPRNAAPSAPQAVTENAAPEPAAPVSASGAPAVAADPPDSDAQAGGGKKKRKRH